MCAAGVAGRDERGELIRPEDESWTEATSVDDVIERWPGRVDMLLEAIDLDREGLEDVKAAVESDDRAQACRALLEYYEDTGRCEWIVERLPEPNERHLEIADDILERKHHKGDTVGTVPVQNGAWDWNYTGPKENREYAFNLNRHQFFKHLLLAWQKTGEKKYAEAFDRIVRDWIVHTVYPGEDHQYVWTWRVLEAGLRMRSWLPAFHGFLESDGFSPAGRLLMLSSFVQHGEYIKMHHWEKHNHALMEFDGLNRLGLALPELEKAEEWHRYAMEKMLGEMDHQVYPDGAHDELSSGYHWVSLSSYEAIADICRDAGRDVPEDYRERLVDMYDYWVGLVRPDGSMPQNNRSDRSRPIDRIVRAAEKYDRPEWRYIVTNGKEGERPEGLPSRFAPYAGHLVSRSGWGEDALWSFFDAGPAGAGWVDPDALHLSVTAFGKDFLIDSGRFWYERDKWTTFAHSSRSHNVILIDGCEQEAKPKKTNDPLPRKHWGITEGLDYARATHERFEGLEGEVAHTRTVVFVRDVGWVVVDRVETDGEETVEPEMPGEGDDEPVTTREARPRTLTPMWRFRPEREVQIAEGDALITTDEEGANLSITPVGSVDWDVELIRGQEDPHLQGWYSEKSTEWEPNTCAEYHGRIEDDAVFAWIMLPTEQGTAAPAEGATLEVSDDGATVEFSTRSGEEMTVTVPLSAGEP
ncbi:MAG: heparinase II/III family protein, partial [Candidatus Brocadiia bacterium]